VPEVTDRWTIPVLTRVGRSPRRIVIRVKDGDVEWDTPTYPYVVPRESDALLIAAITEAREAADKYPQGSE
jgi:hypothetical protein